MWRGGFSVSWATTTTDTGWPSHPWDQLETSVEGRMNIQQDKGPNNLGQYTCVGLFCPSSVRGSGRVIYDLSFLLPAYAKIGYCFGVGGNFVAFFLCVRACL